MHLSRENKQSYLDLLDPRVRVAVAFTWVCVSLSLSSHRSLSIALMVSFLFLMMTNLKASKTLIQVAAVESFIIALVALLPFTTPGETWFTVFGFDATYEGAEKALFILMRSNASMLAVIALIGTLPTSTFVAVLNAFKLPTKLVQLMAFTLRYIDLIFKEYQRIRNALKIRGFVPQRSVHTMKTFGFVIGSLLLNTLERSERTLDAMKCRGYSGKFPFCEVFVFTLRDSLFLLAIFGMVVVIYSTEWVL
ncbi:cobalt ECF transporter T component CbiQ [Enterovibrio nigricans]|nr:cobalt ECF transporter T component CbiQ [Enterovibrio nigricans]PKF49268.1 cobalt ECF transporter T component CbiQ [Enterovibrio nigricans]